MGILNGSVPFILDKSATARKNSIGDGDTLVEEKHNFCKILAKSFKIFAKSCKIMDY